MNFVIEHLPEHPAYYEKDALTDRNDRFFASEMIRAQVFKQYKKEIPYSSEVIITAFIEGRKTAPHQRGDHRGTRLAKEHHHR